MKPSNDLFQLIHSMSQTEKRDFRIFASKFQPAQKKYWEIFIEVGKQTSYDEGAIKQKLSGIMEPKNFPSAKNYLLKLLSNFFVQSQQTETPSGQCRAGLERAIMYYRRGLQKAAQKELTATQKNAQKYELIEEQIKANELQMLMINRFHNKRMDTEMNKLLKERTELKKIRENEEVLEEVFYLLSPFMRRDLDRKDAKIQKNIESIAKRPELQSNHIPITFNAKRRYHQARAFCFHLLGNAKAEYQEYQKQLELWEKESHQQQEDHANYRIALCNFLHIAAKNNDHSRFPAIFKKLETIPIANEEDELEQFSIVEFYQLLHHLDTRQLDQAKALAETIPAKIDRYHQNLPESTLFGFKANLMLLYFLLGDVQTAQHWVEGILQYRQTDSRKKIQALARTFEVILFIEKEDWELANAKAKALGEWLRTNQLLTDWEKFWINKAAKLANTHHAQHQKIWQQISTEMETFSPETRQLPGNEELYLWVQSKIQHKTIRQILASNQSDWKT